MRRTVGERIFGACNNTFMLVLIVVTIYPFLHVLFSSLSLPSRLVKHTGLLFAPLGVTLDSYRMVFENPMILLGYRNTLFVMFTGTALNVLLTMLGAYALSRRNFLYRKPCTLFIIFTMFFSGGLIPFYLQVRALGLADNLLALILPSAVSTTNLIVMRTAFASIPYTFEEAAKIDGAHDFTVLFKLFVPLALPTVAVIILFYAVEHWNAWFNAMIFLRNRELYPLQIILREILIASSTEYMMTDIGGADKELVGETIKYATIIVATVPILMIYPFLQKYFIKGVMIGALKE